MDVSPVAATVDDDDLLETLDNQWKCTICGKILPTLDGAGSHVIAHKAFAEGFTCLLCGRTFRDRMYFAVHMSRRHKKPLS